MRFDNNPGLARLNILLCKNTILHYQSSGFLLVEF